MKKVTVKVPAKINLTLDILGVNNGYHDIESLVGSIDVYDTITVSERKDGKINLVMKGRPVDCLIYDNNAYKASKAFIEKYGVAGVDVVIDKKIPVAGGLGGSSADIAGVLNALKILYQIDDDMSFLAGELGSDAIYMLTGGYAVLKGRGEKVEKTDADRTIYLLLITDDKIISARNCYKRFDQKKKKYEGVTENAKRKLYQGDLQGLFPLLKNDLLESAVDLVPTIKNNLFALEKAGAPKVLLAGSGPTVYGLFFDKKERDNAYKKLKGLYGDDVIKAQTVVPNKSDDKKEQLSNN